MTIADLLLALIAIFAAAKLFGEIAERLGQPAVLGEMLGGVVIGASGLHLVDPHNEVVHLLSELGVILLLFLIGLETDLRKLLSVGAVATLVAIVGVTAPFVGGFYAAHLLGYDTVPAIFLGAALTATSVGITARVLSDLGHLQGTPAQIILGAAVVDDVIGLVILTIVGSMAGGTAITFGKIAHVTGVAFGFVIAAVVLGLLLAPTLVKIILRLRVAKALFFASVMFAFALAFIAQSIGSAMIVGAFAAGLVLARTEQGRQIEHEVHDIAQFFVPIFFVVVGAAIDLRSLNPFEDGGRKYLLIGLLLTVVGVVGKMLAGLVVRRKVASPLVVGIGMIPRGEVGLIFAQVGLSTKILDAGLYSSVALMVIATTFITPPLLRKLLPPQKSTERRRPGNIVTEAP